MGFKQIFKRDELTEADKIGPVDNTIYQQIVQGSTIKMGTMMPKSVSEDILRDAIADKAEATPEEWIWVDGFKGTDAHMCCRDYQFEMNKQFNIPADVEPKECESGFHLCLKLDNVFKYYHIEDSNRFFRVRALVRRADLERVNGKIDTSGMNAADIWRTMCLAEYCDKLTSKSIIFLSELTPDEILAATNYDTSEWSKEDKAEAMKAGPVKVRDKYCALELMTLGYSKLLAEYMVNHRKYDIAKALGSQKDLSMDARIIAIFEDD